MFSRMDPFALLFGLPIMMVVGIPSGFFRLFTGFGFLYAFPIVFLFVLACFAKKYSRTRWIPVFTLAAVLGQWLSLFSWILSRQTIFPTEATRVWGLDLPSVAKAGFPVVALEIPPSPMGNDTIPMDLWQGVFTNHLFWFFVAFILAWFLCLKLEKKFASAKKIRICFLLALLALFYNLALFVFWYD